MLLDANIEELYCDDDQIKEAYDRLKNSVRSKRAYPVSYRKEQLRQLKKIVDNEKEAVAEALKKDLHKGYAEGIVMEIASLENEIRIALAQVDEWTKPEYVSKPLLYAMDNVHVVHDPLGMVLIIGAWNYPVQLAIMPLVGAIAGGNCAIIKPSELAPHSARLVTELITKYMDPECYMVLNGGAEETQKILKYRWDHVFYTGSNKVAKHVMRAAAENLTPVTLELGGKNPAYVHSDVDYEVTSKRLGWAKFMNVGQTCLAPDYVLCHEAAVDGLCDALVKTAKKFYTDNPKEFGEYGRVINKIHLRRIVTMLDNSKGEVVLGGDRDEEERYLAPTIVKNVKIDDSLMEDEIFGPIIPIIAVESYQKAVDIINDRDEKSLSMSVFSKDKKVAEYFRDNTTSGSFVANDMIVQAGCLSLPFGGVGSSGTGSYHGKHSFDNLTHAKSVLMKSQGGEAMVSLRYPPISVKTAERVYWLLMHREYLEKAVGWIKSAFLVVALAVIVITADRFILRSKL